MISGGTVCLPAVKDAGGVPLFCWPCLFPPSTALSIRFRPFLECCGKVHAQLLQPWWCEGFSLRHLAAPLLPAQASKVERPNIRFFRKSAVPYPHAVRSRRKWKVHQEPEPPQERLVQERFPIGRKDRQPTIIFHALQQIIDFYVRITVMAVA